MIEKLIQDNVVVLRTIRLPRDKLVHPRDEVSVQVLNLLAKKLGIAR
jgi:hypothetical protein